MDSYLSIQLFYIYNEFLLTDFNFLYYWSILILLYLVMDSYWSILIILYFIILF